jgi:group I intron endonuclease
MCRVLLREGTGCNRDRERAKHARGRMTADNNSQIGIYSITNKENHRVYIGSTTISFFRRWREHRNQLISGRHCNIHLQSDWNTYGEDAFMFDAVEVCNSVNGITILEQKHIDKYFDNGVMCYNISKKATNPSSVPAYLSFRITTSQEIINFIRDTKIGKMISPGFDTLLGKSVDMWLEKELDNGRDIALEFTQALMDNRNGR